MNTKSSKLLINTCPLTHFAQKCQLGVFLFSSAVYSDQTDISSYPETDRSFSSNSILSDFGEAPLSSTRRSSFFNLSNMNGRPNTRGMSCNRLFDTDTRRNHGWDDNFSEGASILSSTRMSVVGSAAAMPVLKEEDLFTTDDVFTYKATEHVTTTDDRLSPLRRDTEPAVSLRRMSRKSVSFKDVDEYCPVFSPESHKQELAVGGSRNLSFDPSEYSDFLNSERMATVLHKQGIDVTSPDHVYVFCRESSTSTEEDMEKTVISHCALEGSDDENEGEHAKEPEHPVRSCGGSSSSETSSHYSSCESDHYTSALEPSTHPKHGLPPFREGVCIRTELKKNTQDCEFSEDKNTSPVQTERIIDSESKKTEHLTGVLDVVDAKNEDCVDKPVADTSSSRVDALKENPELTFTPSPFVTGRTRSRLSRCSLRTSRTPESFSVTSSLFEETLPTPVRTRRQTPRSQGSEDYCSSPPPPFYAPSYSESSTGGDFVTRDYSDMQSNTLRACSSDSISQADTLILSKSMSNNASKTQTVSDTVLLEKTQDTSVDAYERNLAEVILDMQRQNLDRDEGRDFLTDDPTSTDENSAKGNANNGTNVGNGDRQGSEDVWITEDFSSQSDSASSSSSSSYFSPRRTREDSDLPCTPGTGCTPRYSMSRLSSCHQPQHPANLSYTPGGRPHIQDLDEPVDYLYTDTEQGHKLIETHVPPTANTSMSSSVSNTSSDETVLYDWRSVHTDAVSSSGKENQNPHQAVLQKEKDGECVDSSLTATKGMTDKELRVKLVELGERPGPINSRTRPTYMRRLRCLLQESNSNKSLHDQKLDQPQTGNTCQLN